MTTKRPPRTAADANLLDYSLTDFSDWLHTSTEYAGALAGALTFADTVTALFDTKAALAQIQKCSDAIYADMREAYDATASDPARRRVGNKELKLVGVREPELTRSVDSKIVRRDHNDAWAASRILKPRFSVSAKAVRDIVEVDGLDAIYPKRTSDIATLMDARAALRDLRKSFTADEEAYKARLEQIATTTGWDGQARTFLDGWKVQTSVLQFDADTFAEMFPELYDALAVDKLGGGNVGRLDFGPVEQSGACEDDDNFTGWKTVKRKGGGTQRVYFVNGEMQERDEIDGD
jgi:hypothetical protein